MQRSLAQVRADGVEGAALKLCYGPIALHPDLEAQLALLHQVSQSCEARPGLKSHFRRRPCVSASDWMGWHWIALHLYCNKQTSAVGFR